MSQTSQKSAVAPEAGCLARLGHKWTPPAGNFWGSISLAVSQEYECLANKGYFEA